MEEIKGGETVAVKSKRPVEFMAVLFIGVLVALLALPVVSNIKPVPSAVDIVHE